MRPEYCGQPGNIPRLYSGLYLDFADRATHVFIRNKPGTFDQALRAIAATKKAGKLFHSCAAGRGFIYIKANGDVWPCPFEIQWGCP
ncbi:MAG: hypothetical protein CVU54_12990 [Deltaproteobacteria bacterium HGW-Deltaproteobacteria-12]|nr:MAG: hypothetical protein CVU54_12990 [Deltaproteobacteria bacterium HGW-Deltaproteobacteria-12]